VKRYISILALLICVAGCGRMCETKRPKDVIADINGYMITKDEFEAGFKESANGKSDTPKSRRDFMQALVNKTLVIQDAQAKGLDKDESFLKMVERFWSQSLFKLAVDRKSGQLAGTAVIKDSDIKAAYDRLAEQGRATRSYQEMFPDIKWELTRLKESQSMSEWLNDLNKKAAIKIDYDAVIKKKITK